MKTIKGWIVTNVTLRNKPHAWRNINNTEQVVIDILNRNDEKRAYPVVLHKSGMKKLLGYGYAKDPKESWDGTLENATKIAYNYMRKH